MATPTARSGTGSVATRAISHGNCRSRFRQASATAVAQTASAAKAMARMNRIQSNRTQEW